MSEGEGSLAAMPPTFTIFWRYETSIEGWSDVTVGATFENSQSEEPSSQWCYIDELGNPGQKISLKSKIAGEVIDAEVVAASNLTDEQLAKASSLCKFVF